MPALTGLPQIFSTPVTLEKRVNARTNDLAVSARIAIYYQQYQVYEKFLRAGSSRPRSTFCRTERSPVATGQTCGLRNYMRLERDYLAGCRNIFHVVLRNECPALPEIVYGGFIWFTYNSADCGRCVLMKTAARLSVSPRYPGSRDLSGHGRFRRIQLVQGDAVDPWQR